MSSGDKKIPKELAAAIGCRAASMNTSVWGDNRACCEIKHLACGKSHCTKIYAKRETAEQNAKRWLEKHLLRCKKTLEADAAFERAQDLAL